MRWVVMSLLVVSCGSSEDGGTSGAGGAAASGGTAGTGAVGGNPGCVPNQQIACACGGGEEGYQTCLPDGSGFQPCFCADAGAGGGAGTGGAGTGGAAGASTTGGAGGAGGGAACNPALCPQKPLPAKACCVTAQGPCGVDWAQGDGCQATAATGGAGGTGGTPCPPAKPATGTPCSQVQQVCKYGASTCVCAGSWFCN
ncbi:MAG: hypothetical protein HS104_22225 [Polyangiaceae bacterium]|nr:hypothetical protein [Polyangiaceae bacterium]MCL4750005.1 hypothetical protein [Myxococcales bacterium]